MNDYADSNSPAVRYYDSDYPWREDGVVPENFDEIAKSQGLHSDVDRYKEIASYVGGPVLDICCGTGRVAIPLAKAGFEVTGVDNAEGILNQFRSNLQRFDSLITKGISIVNQDAARLELPNRDFRLAIIAFNSLLVISDFDAQRQTLRRVAQHLSHHGVLVLDIVNPLRLKIDGDPVPKPFFTRRSPASGNTYMRFAASGPFDENHRQHLRGWYDEIDSNGYVTRQHYSIYWRPIFRFEIELMLHEAGLKIHKIEGGHLKEPYTVQSPRMFIQATKQEP